MVKFLFISVVVLIVAVLVLIGYIWYQFNSTESKLFKIIDRRISLYHAGDGPLEDDFDDEEEDV